MTLFDMYFGMNQIRIFIGLVLSLLLGCVASAELLSELKENELVQFSTGDRHKVIRKILIRQATYLIGNQIDKPSSEPEDFFQPAVELLSDTSSSTVIKVEFSALSQAKVGPSIPTFRKKSSPKVVVKIFQESNKKIALREISALCYLIDQPNVASILAYYHDTASQPQRTFVFLEHVESPFVMNPKFENDYDYFGHHDFSYNSFDHLQRYLSDDSSKVETTIRENLSLFRSMVAGVKALHAKGIVHHDLKIDNMRIASGHVGKIIDFNAASFDDHLDRACSWITYRAASLERIFLCLGTEKDRENAKEIYDGPASDIFELGLAFIKVLRNAGELDFGPRFKKSFVEDLNNRITSASANAETGKMQECYERKNALVTLIAESIEQLPKDWIFSLFCKMIAVRPSDRPTAKQVEEELDRLAKL